MARMHCNRKGKACSIKPLDKPTPGWMTRTAEEVELLVVKLAKQGMLTSMIGMTLRDSYGVPYVKKVTNKTISQIIAENKLAPEIPENIDNLIRRAALLKKHLEVNKKDLVSKRGLSLMEAKIRRLEKYYKRTKVLKENWKYQYHK